jgi:hypothetical protein
MDIENELMPYFNNLVSEISKKSNVPFLDLTYLNGELIYTDGNHLYKESGEKVSAIIGEWIKTQKSH